MRPCLAQWHQSGATQGQVPTWDTTFGGWKPADPVTGGSALEYRRDDLTSTSGGEAEVVLDKTPIALHIYRNGLLLGQADYTIAGLIVTLGDAAVASDVYTITYWASTAPAATTWRVSLSDEFNDSSIDPKWSWLHQGSGTISESGSTTTLATPSPSGTVSRGQPAPAGDFELSFYSTLTTAGGQFFSSGLLLYDSATGKHITFGHSQQGSSGPTTNVRLWSGSLASPSWGGDSYEGATQNYVRITKTGTTLSFYTSPDGTTWTLRNSQALSAFLGAITNIGFCIGMTNTQTGTLAADFFRVVR